MAQIKESNKTIYIELLRILASIAVIVIHVTAVMIKNYEMDSASWNILIVCNSLSRWCIPLFFMISGCCFLNRENTISTQKIIKQYVLRLAVVLVVFGLFYYFFDLWIYNQSLDIKRIILAPLSVLSGNTGYHLWYLYDMILIYLFIPILQSFLKHADKKLLEYALLLFVVFELLITFFNLIASYVPVLSDVLKINFGLSDLIGYVGCFLLGYYISHYELSKRSKRLMYAVGIAGIVIMPLGNWILSRTLGSYTSAFSDYNGLFSVTLAMCLFYLFKKKENMLKENRFADSIVKLGRSTFGIYLVHVFFVSIIFYKLSIDFMRYNPFIIICVTTMFVFVISYILIRVVKKVPIVKKYL